MAEASPSQSSKQDNAREKSMASPQEPGIRVPIGYIGPVQVSRLICGGNLVIGSAHDRDLIYLPSLMRHYFTDRKIMETWQQC